MYTLKDPQNGSVLNLDSSGPEKEEKKRKKETLKDLFKLQSWSHFWRNAKGEQIDAWCR